MGRAGRPISCSWVEPPPAGALAAGVELLAIADMLGEDLRYYRPTVRAARRVATGLFTPRLRTWYCWAVHWGKAPWRQN